MDLKVLKIVLIVTDDVGVDFDKIAWILNELMMSIVDETHLSPQCKSGTPLCQCNAHLIKTMLVWWSFYIVQTFRLESDLEYWLDSNENKKFDKI